MTSPHGSATRQRSRGLIFLSLVLLLSSFARSHAAAQPEFAPPRILQQKMCEANDIKFSIPAFDWGNWDGWNLPFDISDAQLLKIAGQIRSGSNRFLRDPDIFRKLSKYSGGKSSFVATVARMRVSQSIIANSRSSQREREQALLALKLEAERGVSQAFYSIGRAYELGRFGDPDYLRAMEYYQRGAIAGNSYSMVRLANLYTNGRNPKISPKAAQSSVGEAMARLYAEISEGNCFAIMYIGSIYAEGVVVPRNERLSALWYQTGLDVGFKEAAEILSDFYWKGFGVPQSNAKALSYLTVAAEASIPSAMLNLGRGYATGRYGKQDRVLATQWLERSFKAGELEALKSLVAMYNGEFGGEKEDSKAVSYLEMMISRSTATPSDFFLAGYTYLFGDPAMQNRDKGMEYLEHSASEREGRAANALGDIYLQGTLLKADPSKALRYYRQAASFGNVDAMNAIARLFQCGRYVTASQGGTDFWHNIAAYAGSGAQLRVIAESPVVAKDPHAEVDRARLYKAMAVSGDRIAMVELARLFHEGSGLEKNEPAKDYWISRAVSHGEAQAVGYLAMARAYLDERFDDQDHTKAKKYLELAAESRSVEALVQLGLFNIRFNGFDFDKPTELFRKAAQLGDADAMFELGRRMGDSETQAGKSAAEWIQKAAEMGHASSRIYLTRNAQTKEASEAELDNVRLATGCDVENMSELAQAYLDLETTSGLEKARELLERAEAATLLQPSELFLIGQTYLRNSEVLQDIQHGKKLLERAAALGDKRALRRLAIANLRGVIDSMTRETAMQILSDGAGAGDIESTLQLAITIVGESGDQILDAEKSGQIIKLLVPAAENSVEAARFLALLGLKNKIVGMSTTEAIERLKRCANAADTISMRELGHVYALGVGQQRDPNGFFYWMHKAASRGDEEAMYEIGAAYEAGYGAPADPVEAEKWIATAKQAGLVFSHNLLSSDADNAR